MRISGATEPGSPAAPNEDWWAATPGVIVVLDGVTVPAGMTSGCIHGTPWYVRQLGARLLAMAATTDVPLPVLIGNAIAAVADLHRACDLDALGSPSAAVAVLRLGAPAEYAVLADVSVIADGAGGLVVATDDRVSASTAGLDGSTRDVGARIAERRAAARNRPGGYWVAAADPGAAVHAVTGSVAAPVRAAVMTDGAARVHDMLGVPWESALRMDPAAVISRVRDAESADAACERYPRFKVSDDATAILAD